MFGWLRVFWERPWVLRLAIAICFAIAVFSYLRGYHSSFGTIEDEVRVATAGPALAGLIWTLVRVSALVSVPRAWWFAPGRLSLALLGSVLGWVAVVAMARAVVVLLAPPAFWPVWFAGLTAASVGALYGVFRLYRRARLGMAVPVAAV